MLNILTIDVEDWYDLSGQQLRGVGTPRPDVLARQLDHLLELLARHKTRATCFCLGGSLQHAPHLVRQIADAGHEIGTHGWGHALISQSGLDAFRSDLTRSLDWLGQLLGRPVRGHRAPAFSVAPAQLDGFYDVCCDAGLLYDSSVFPIRGRRYGIPDARVAPHIARERDGRTLYEIPLSTLPGRSGRRPVAGGGHWRIRSVERISAAVEALNRAGLPMVTYLHPYEFDERPLDAFAAAGWSLRTVKHYLKQNLNRGSMYRKLDVILSRHRFGAVEDYLREAGLITT
jgi:polysaccharide deacetylase family protein (PEP-CTERM system associated)